MNKSEIAELVARKLWLIACGFAPDNGPERLAKTTEIVQMSEIVERAIAESQAWISVEEKLPAENERVLWWKVGEHEVDSVHLAEHPEDYFTHWMPLPQPPKGDRKS